MALAFDPNRTIFRDIIYIFLYFIYFYIFIFLYFTLLLYSLGPAGEESLGTVFLFRQSFKLQLFPFPSSVLILLIAVLFNVLPFKMIFFTG